MSNTLNPDQARLDVGPDQGPNSLQSLSADDLTVKIEGQIWGILLG